MLHPLSQFHQTLTRFIKTYFISCLVLFSFALMSFTSGKTAPQARPVKDTTARGMVQDKGFKSLFTHGSIDAAQPLAGQLHPQAVSFVQDYIQKYARSLTKMKEWARPYFSLYDQVFEQYGIPKEMKYLSVIESNLQAGAVSWAGARGPWQFMDFEARRMGLTVNGQVDERTDYVKSTHAAARLLKELYQEFGDWLLVVAAYNGGANRMKRIIRSTGSDDFWQIQHLLPAETRNHVKKFIGTHYLFEGSGGVTTMTGDQIREYEQLMAAHRALTASASNNSESVEVVPVSGRFNASIIMKSLGLNESEFNTLNPAFDKMIGTGGSYQLKLPAAKVSEFQAKKQQILQESVQLLLSGTKL